LPSGGNIDLQYWPMAPAPLSAPVSGNVTANGATVTAAFIQFEQASHGMLQNNKGQHTADLTVPYPYPKKNPPETFMNPTVRLQNIYHGFMKDYFAGVVPTVTTGL